MDDYGDIEIKIDLAEKYLVCGMFKDAAAAAASALDGLRNHQKVSILPLVTHAEPILDSEHGGIKEFIGSEAAESLRHCAGAVLVQAYHGLGRHKELQEALLTYFRSVSLIPNELFCMWIALQLTAGQYRLAGSALQEYLSTSTNTGTNGSPSGTANRMQPLMDTTAEDPTDHASSNGSESPVTGAVPPGSRSSQWAALAEVFTVVVLTRGLQNSAGALEWLESRAHRLTPADQERLTAMVKQETVNPDSRRNSGRNSSVTPQVSTLRTASCDNTRILPEGASSEPARSEARGLAGNQMRDSVIPQTKTDGSKALASRPRGDEIRSASEIVEIGDGDRPTESSSTDSNNTISEPEAAGGNETDTQTWSLLTWLVHRNEWLLDQVKHSTWILWHSQSSTIRRQGGELFGNLMAHRSRLGGILVGVVMLVCMIKGRNALRRAWANILQALRQALGDLWLLAFTVNLNPLAAGQHMIGGGHQPTIRY